MRLYSLFLKLLNKLARSFRSQKMTTSNCYCTARKARANLLISTFLHLVCICLVFSIFPSHHSVLLPRTQTTVAALQNTVMPQYHNTGVTNNPLSMRIQHIKKTKTKNGSSKTVTVQPAERNFCSDLRIPVAPCHTLREIFM